MELFRSTLVRTASVLQYNTMGFANVHILENFVFVLFCFINFLLLFNYLFPSCTWKDSLPWF